MNNIRLTTLGCLLAGAMLAPASGRAQATASPYSLFGIGEVEMGNYGENSGMAGLGIGFRQDNTLNPANPASLTAIGPQYFVFDGSVFGKISRFTGQGESYQAGTGSLQRVAIGFRASSRWMMSVGLAPLSSVGYKIWNDTPVEGAPLTLRSVFAGEGGMNRVYWSHGLRLTDHLSVGVTGSVAFGTITRTEDDASGWHIEERQRGQKIYFDFGLQYIGMLNENTRLSIGAVGGYESRMNMRNTRLAYNQNIVDAMGTPIILTDDVLPTTQQYLPAFYGVGFSVNRRNQFVAGVDYRYQQWSNTAEQASYVRYKNMHKLSAGVSYIPNLYAGESYWQQIKYQGGVSVNDSYLRIGGKSPLNYAATVGAVFPMMGGNSLSFAAEYGKSGLLGSRNAVRENYVKFTLGFSFKERWFMKVRYD
jgi:hypothetical protein